VVDFIFHSIVLIGICFIVKYGSILNFVRTPLKKIKFFEELFACALCLGFHIGLWSSMFIKFDLLTNISTAFYSAAICWVADHVISALQTYIYGRD
jgi:hypothetical protein